MADNQNTNGGDNTNQNQNTDDQNKGGTDDQNKGGDTGGKDIEALIQERLNEALKDVKAKLDKAYGARDEALTKVKEFEQKEREAEIKRLQEEGKHKEVLEMQLAEERAAREALEKRNTELSRDVTVRAALSGLEFRNDKAAEIAFKEITSQLTQNENGVWVHKSGVSVNDFIGAFAKDEDQSFLFKTKTNNGGGSSSNTAGGTNTAGKPKSLFEMSQEEVLKLAREGKLPQRK